MSKNVKSHKTALVRVDYNVPMHNGVIQDFTRIKASLATIKYLLKQNFSIILMSHLGRPLKQELIYSLKPLIGPLEKLIGEKIHFIEKPINKESFKGRIGLLENVRFFDGEEKNDPKFCKDLSVLGDIYVNDAFGVSHRKHASTYGIHRFFSQEKYKGFLLELELAQLKKLKDNPPHPYTIIVGGAKIGSKIHMLEAFLDIADSILIGGGMAFPFIKYLGGEIGSSLCQDNEIDIVRSFLERAKNSKTKIFFPKDCLSTISLNKNSETKIIDISNVPPKWMGVDIGPKTIKLFRDIISQSKSIMWNGPMGVSEIDRFANGTMAVASSIINATNKGAYTLVGGGDTVSDINRLGFINEFSYVSTGGGAMLEFFKNTNLPGATNLKSLKTTFKNGKK